MFSVSLPQIWLWFNKEPGCRNSLTSYPVTMYCGKKKEEEEEPMSGEHTLVTLYEYNNVISVDVYLQAYLYLRYQVTTRC